MAWARWARKSWGRRDLRRKNTEGGRLPPSVTARRGGGSANCFARNNGSDQPGVRLRTWLIPRDPGPAMDADNRRGESEPAPAIPKTGIVEWQAPSVATEPCRAKCATIDRACRCRARLRGVSLTHRRPCLRGARARPGCIRADCSLQTQGPGLSTRMTRMAGRLP